MSSRRIIDRRLISLDLILLEKRRGRDLRDRVCTELKNQENPKVIQTIEVYLGRS